MAVQANPRVLSGCRIGCRVDIRIGKTDVRLVASVALRPLRHRNMVTRFGKGIGCGIRTIVTSGAIRGGDRACSACVVHGGRCPGGSAGMANITLGSGRNVAGRLGKRISSNIRTVVTGRTNAGSASVVHGRRDSPAGKTAGIGMACIALSAGGDMCGGLGQRIGKQVRTVMAIRT